jgi:VanZ family protein
MPLNLLLTRLYRTLKSKKVLLVYLPLIIYWLIIFTLTTVPTEAPQLFDFQDKVEHFLAYFVLGSLLTLTLHFQNKISIFVRRTFIIALILIFFYGALDEIHQYFIPGRDCDFFDWLADIFGGSVGVAFITKFVKKYKDISA